MTTAVAIVVDLVAITVLTYAIYFPRHRRKDMLIAYLGLNVGILAVTLVLSGSSVPAGLGLGLFGVLSIIRLRSSQLTQEEVAYYFAALALGLIAGLHPSPAWITPLVAALVLGVMYVADHPRLLDSARQQTVTLDRAIANEAALRRHLAHRLGGDVHKVVVLELDLVRDVTVVDVRYRVRPEHHQLDSLDAETGQPVAVTVA